MWLVKWKLFAKTDEWYDTQLFQIDTINNNNANNDFFLKDEEYLSTKNIHKLKSFLLNIHITAYFTFLPNIGNTQYKSNNKY
jgi:hypothetical protein